MTSIDLAALYPVDDADIARLHTRLATAAEHDDVLDVAYRTVDSPVGSLLIAATPIGLVRVAFDSEGNDAVLQSLSDRISSRVLNAPARLDAVASQLDEYFSGRRHRFDVPLDWQLSKGFRRTVLEHLATDIGYGTTASYGTLARLSGSPKAVRAVGTTCATNPIPVVVPCHRVVRADGTMGQYRGGPVAKRTLLDLEGAQ
ncbi:methylated-DNA--[protein]-cysteine S-methyltransferase [Mycobacterium cookii]|uniref:Methylated-DNA--protein-cysteine methyltransferase n=1 Tax=Mycobacterium cookii TaxID=1775 RepID=A0A7I7KXI8_9MYCO|nr:methylated-DNA--[protein]-cysteine S-methyltransferase [Mycobacterium cookii]MCV7330880.1 methylated-DNA--[protein]-cysteine S-methyltransferase [Mycobacterium cookii]BBX46524.1 methylated-DNA--protein-cysteine methyltransferase [Mycobacterium cookii]